MHEFEERWLQAQSGLLSDWLNSPKGSLAMIILLDQLPLNMYRNHPDSFKTESLAIQFAKQSVHQGFDQQLNDQQKMFIYLPFMHSENMDDQNLSVALFQQAGLTLNLEFALHHRNIIQQFGRFPHRNNILGRQSTQAELDYLASDHAFTG